MSVTFHITNSPTIDRVEECFCVYDGEAAEGCYCCHGTGQMSCPEFEWPWTNLANINARNVLLAIGVVCGDELYGSWEGETLDRVITGCLRALNSESRRAVATREGYHVPGGYAGTRVVQEGNLARIERMGAEMHVCAYPDERVCLRVRELLDICRKAKEEGESVVWG